MVISCNWVISALSAALSTRVGRRRKFGEISCMKCTGQGNDFKLIQTVATETRHPVVGYFFSEFLAICNHCGVMAAWSCKTLKIRETFAFLEKNPYWKFFQILLRKFSSWHRLMCCVQVSWTLADSKSVKSCVALPDKNN